MKSNALTTKESEIFGGLLQQCAFTVASIILTPNKKERLVT